MDVCTIIAKNYVAHARVLARSLAEHNPDSRLWTLVIDRFDGYIDPVREPFEVLTPEDIDCEPFAEMAIRYSVLELSTAVKPWLLRHLMGHTGAPVTYLDPDIRIYGSLQRLDNLASRHGVVLIPHNNAPIPFDERTPSQVDIMIAGVYNLGYVSLAARPEVDQLLDWWADRLRRDCRVDPVWGYFVDQRWFDLAPGFLTDLAIVRDPEYNVAYWNLHNRRVELQDGRYLVDGRPLAFFHFSGFDPEHPLVLSRHQNRIDVTADPVLEGLLADYAAEVLAAGHAASRGWPYSYASLDNGLPADRTLRALYDLFVKEVGTEGGPPSPFTSHGGRAFQEWLGSQAPDAPEGINRVVAHVYGTRLDLREAFPDLEQHRDGLLAWVQEHGTQEVPLLAALTENGDETSSERRPRLLPRAIAPSGARVEVPAFATEGAPTSGEAPFAPLHDAPWGVNVVGYFRSEVGTGEAGRQVVRALDAADIPVLPVHGQTIPLSRQGHEYETAAPEDAPYPINLICMNADMLPEFAAQVGDEFFAERYSIGLWFWEVSRFPEQWHPSFSLLEEVWAPTTHVARVLESVATVPVATVRVPISVPAIEPSSRGQLGVPEDRFVFLFNFDYLSVFARKNPLAVVDAFKAAFAPGEGAALVLKCINADRDPASHTELEAAVAGHPDISLIHRYMSPAENLSLTAVCDCYVSLHRAEGLGLVMAEAMWFGKPVIATGYSGNLDFMTSENSLLVDHRLVPIGPGADPYPPDGEWADPDVEHAATLMRQLFDDPAAARALGARAARDIRRTHSPEAAGQIMIRRLEAIRGTGRVRPAVDRVRTRSPATQELAAQIQRGPAPAPRAAAGSPRARLRSVVRRLLLRLARPVTAYQRRVNLDTVAALDELNRRIVETRRAAAAERARLLVEVRKLEEHAQERDRKS